MLRYFCLLFIVVLSFDFLSAANGPGFPNVDYAPAQAGSVLSMNDPGKAISGVMMHRGYLFVPLGADHGGGQGAGAFAFYDISDPSSINAVFDSRNHSSDYHDPSKLNYVGNWAELHHIPVSDDLILISERGTDGGYFSIFDVSNLYDGNPSTKPETISRFKYPGLTSVTNYDNFAFAIGWQGSKYVWAPTSHSGLFIVDTSDPLNPTLLKHLDKFGDLDGVTARSAIPIGNLLIVTTVAVGGTFHALFLDISDPENPVKIDKISGLQGYQPFNYGPYFTGGAAPIELYDFSDPYNITSSVLSAGAGLDRPEYGFGKDNYLFIGHYPGMTKWDLTTGQKVEEVNSGLVDDHAFITPIGNLIAISSDHNNDRKLILGIHDHNADNLAPSVNFVSPATGSVNVHLKSRIGVCFTDFIDATTVNQSTMYLRKFGESGAVPGTFSTMMGIVNFAPDSELEQDTVYQFVLNAGGVCDQAGNAIDSEVIVTEFSTGNDFSVFGAAVITDDPKEFGETTNLSLSVINSASLNLEYSWDFGDGSAPTAFAPATSASHVYSLPGNYLVNARVRIVGETTVVNSSASVQVVHAPLVARAPVQSTTIVYDGENGPTVGGGSSVLNHSFESGGTSPSAWTLSGSAIGTTASSIDGAYSLELSAASSSARQTFALNPNTDYTISVWIDASSMVSGNAVFDTNDVFDGSGEGQFVMYNSNGGWVERTGAFNSGSETSLTLRIFTNASFSGSIYYDNIVVSPAVGPSLVWNVNPDNGTVSAIDGNTSAKIYEVAVGDNPKSLALVPANKLWVINKNDATISVINRSTGIVDMTYNLPYASAPHGLVVDELNSVAYISLEALGQVVKVNISNGQIVDTLNVGPWPRGLSIDFSRNELWVSRFISPDDAGKVSRIDLSSFTLTSLADLAIVNEADTQGGGRGLPNYLSNPAVSPDGLNAYIAAKKDNIQRGMLRDGLDLTFENTVRSMVTAIDLSTGMENASALMDLDNDEFGTAIQYSAYGNQIFVLTNGGSLWALDAYDHSVNMTASTHGLAPDGFALSPDGKRIFIHNFMSRSVSVFDAQTGGEGMLSGLNMDAVVNVVSSETLNPQILLGKQLFYDSRDPRLSLEGYMSCASCHLDGGSDGRVWDLTGFGEGLRNTITLNGAGQGHGPRHWSANFDEIQDFEGQIRTLSQGFGLMDDGDFNLSTRSHPMGLAKSGTSSELDALAAYVNSLTTAGLSPHRNSDGTLTAAAISGRQIFEQKNCGSCHSGDAFTDSVSLVRHNVGTMTVASGQRLGSELDGLDTPTLHGLWKSAPYLHDGSAADVMEVLTSKNISGLHGNLFDLTAAELSDLEQYLLQIDDLEISAPVTSVNAAPLINNPGDQLSEKSQSVSLLLSATDPESDPLSWFANGLPAGLSIDKESGIISGASAAVGQHTVTIGVRDNFGNSHSVSIAWTINNLSNLGEALGYRYVRLIADSEVNGNPWASLAELNMLDESGNTLDRSTWVLSVNSEQSGDLKENAIDGDVNTFWHTVWSTPDPDLPHPHHMTVDFGIRRIVTEVRYLPRQNMANGRIADYRFMASNDSVNWDLLAQGTFLNNTNEQIITLTPETGGITREWWNGISGTAVSNLTNDGNYPSSPSGTEVLSSFDGPNAAGENFGARIHGFITPPVSGSYTFWLASDDASQLWISSDSGSSNVSLVAEQSNWISYQNWNSAASGTVDLQAGQWYYIMALHKEGTGGDHISVAWQGPGFSREVISGAYLKPFSASGNTAPQFDQTTYQMSFDENATSGSVIGAVTAQDNEVGQILTYSIVSGNSQGAFVVDPFTGIISVSGTLDYEVRSRYDLTVMVEDDGAPAMSSTVIVTVLLNNLLESNEEVIVSAMNGPGAAFPQHANPALVGFNADPDADGIVNAIEILMGTDPEIADLLPESLLTVVNVNGNDYIDYQFEVDSTVDALLNYRIQGSSDLQSWNDLSNPMILLNENAGMRTYQIRDHLSLDGEGKRFYRLFLDEAE